VRLLNVFVSKFSLTLVLMIAFEVLSAYSSAQTAQLSGVIRDSSGAVLTGATVTVLDKDTGEARATESNAEGSYSVAALKPGDYKITLAVQGFQALVYDDVAVHVGQELKLDFRLQPGRVQESVVVSGEAPLLNTTTSSSDSTVTPHEIEQMPINGRDYLDLLQLVPGVAVNRQQNPGTDAAVPVLGERGGNTVFLIDGLSNRDDANGGAAAPFNQETIAEFQAITTGYKAEFGHGSGGIINVITRSGTNQWRGVASAFHRNNAFDSSDNSDSGAPFVLRWDPSLTLGGPLVKDRVFLFTSAEYIREVRQLNFVFPPETPQALMNFENGFDQPSTDRETRLFAKLDEILGQHRLSEEINWTNSHIANFLPLSEATDLPSTRTNSTARHLLLGFSDTALLGARSDPWVLALRGNYRSEPSASGPAHPSAGPSTSFYAFSGLNTGGLAGDIGTFQFGAPLTPGEFDQKYGDFGVSLAKDFGRHSIKFGAEYTREDANGFENSRQFNELLATLSDFTEFGPINSGFFSLQTDGAATPQLDQIRIRNNYVGSYAQDDWKIANNLVLNLGVRWDFDSRFGAKHNFSPRLGFAWAVTPKTVVRGSFGYFYDHFRLGLARDIPGFGGASILHTQSASFPRLFYGNPSIFPDVLLGICFSPVYTDAQVAAMGLTCPYGTEPYYGVDHLNHVAGSSLIPDNAIVNLGNVQSLSGLSPQQYADQASIALGQPAGYFFWGPFGALSTVAFGQGADVLTVDPNFATPFTRGFTVGVQRQVGQDWVISVDYYYKQIRNILGARQTNLTFADRIPGNTFTGQAVDGFGPWFSGTYNAAIVAVRKRVNRRFSFGGSYSFTHEIDDQGCTNLGGNEPIGFAATTCLPADSFVGMTTLVTDPTTGQTNANGSFTASNGASVPKAGIFYNGPSLDRGPSDFSIPQTLEAHGLVQLPWQIEISSLFRVQSGFAYSKQLATPIDVDGSDNFTFYDFNAGRNHFRAPVFTNTDMRFSKAIKIREHVRVQMFFEFFNLFNRANPAAVQETPGQPTPIGEPLQVLPGREGQIGTRIEF